MSTLVKLEKKCIICGNTQCYTEVASTNTFGGYMDLDTRPPEMERSTLIYEVQLCDKCSYANYDISELIEGITPNSLKSANYQAVAIDEKIDKHAKAFLLAAHLHLPSKQYRAAGVLFLNAAWVFDDLNEREYAIRARKKAIEFISKYVEESADVNFGAVTVDMLRRIGQFEDAAETAMQLIDYGVEDLLEKVLKLQLELCGLKDDRCCNMLEAL